MIEKYWEAQNIIFENAMDFTFIKNLATVVNHIWTILSASGLKVGSITTPCKNNLTGFWILLTNYCYFIKFLFVCGMRVWEWMESHCSSLKDGWELPRPKGGGKVSGFFLWCTTGHTNEKAAGGGVGEIMASFTWAAHMSVILLYWIYSRNTKCWLIQRNRECVLEARNSDREGMRLKVKSYYLW